MKITKEEIAKIVEEELQKEGLFDFFRSKKKEPEAPAPEMEPEAPPEEDLTPAWEKAIENAAIALSSRGVWGSNELVKAMGNTWFHREIENNLTPGGWTQAHFQDALRKAFPLAVGPERIEYLGDVEKMAYAARDAVGQKKWDRERERSSQKDDEYEWRGGDMRRVKSRPGYGSTQYESKTNDTMASLMENWRSYEKKTLLVEQDQKVDKVAKALANPNVGLNNYVGILKRYAADPEFRKMITSGDKDADPSDEKVTVTRASAPAAKLKPTQAEIGFEQSLKDQVTNPAWKPVQKALGLDGEPIIMPSTDNPPPAILVWNGTYILDGHHRWSQVMMMNPTGKVAIDNVTGPAIDNEEEALKAMQMAIAAGAKNVVTKAAQGANLMQATDEQVSSYVMKNITDEVLQLLVQAKKIAKPDKQLAANYIAGNLKHIKKHVGKFPRAQGMPQAGASGIPQDKVNKLLGTGKINFDAPSPADSGAKQTRDIALQGAAPSKTKGRVPR